MILVSGSFCFAQESSQTVPAGDLKDVILDEGHISGIEIAKAGGRTVHGGEARPSSAEKSSGFRDNKDGTITDTATGLVWMKDAGVRADSRVKASEYCGRLKTGGYTDWRLPTVKEFATMITPSHGNEELRKMLLSWGFVNTGDYYWTLLDDAPFEDFAWNVDTGFSPMPADKQKNNFVWPVRGGK